MLNWSGINEVYFEASGGTRAGFESQTFQFAIDNLSVTTPVPEPGTLLLLGAGLAVAAVRLRRSRA